MALDEALLEAMPRLANPVLRFYGWTEPAASFGYFQKYAQVERLTKLRPLIRRPTGGGVVPHQSDWTYSLMFPTCHPWYALVATESYRRAHEWIRAALATLSVETNLAPQRLPNQQGECFLGYEQFDVLFHGRKIAGAAQRRRRDGLLIQGSMQPPWPELSRVDWQQAMYKVASAESRVRWSEFVPDEALHERAMELAKQKYSQQLYNQRR